MPHGAGFNPDSIAGLKLWLKADSLSLNDADPVTTWTDSSGEGNDVTQATASKKPTYRTNVLNALPVVRFDGGDNLRRASALFAVGTHTIFVVCKKVTSAASKFVFDSGPDGGIGRRYLQFTASGLQGGRDGAGGEIVNSTGTAGDFILVREVINGASSELEINDSTVAGTISSSATASTSPFILGARFSEDASFYDGDIGELLIYEGVLSSADQDKVEHFLEEKYFPVPARVTVEEGVAKLAVRLKTARTDMHITKDVKDLSFRSVVPGGYASCELHIDRKLSLDPDEIQLYGDLYVYDGRNGATVWQGRLEDPGRGAGSQGETWTVRAVGPMAHTRDRKVPLIYVDQSMERWHRYTHSDVRESTHPAGRDVIGQDQGGTGKFGALLLHIPRGVLVTTLANLVGREYRSLNEVGMKLARIAYTADCGQTNADWKVDLTVVGIAGGQRLHFADTHTTTAFSRSKVVVTDFVNGRDGVELSNIYDPGVGFADATVGDDNAWVSFYDVTVRSLLVDTAGADITTGYTVNTVLASEVVKDLLGRLLTKYDGPNSSVTTTSFAIEQLAYPDGVHPADVLSDLMRFENDFYWAAWEESKQTAGKARFEWKAWPTTVRYEASPMDGDFDSPGSASDLYNRVTVRWRDKDGRIRKNTRTQTVQVLTDAGLTREALIDLGDDMGSSANADRVGDEFLADHALPPNAGSLTVRRPIADIEKGRRVQPWEILPGNLIRIHNVKPRVDALNATARDAVTVFRIVAVTYRSSDNSVQLELDSLQLGVPQAMAALMGGSRSPMAIPSSIAPFIRRR